ncbi:MAG: FCD domain-containing protein [Halomonas sp.]
MARATHNPAFLHLYEQLSPSGIPRTKLLNIEINPAAAARYLERAQAEHAFILEAILSRDAEAAKETMFQHLNRSRNMYAQYQDD